jgi:alpha-glucosidase
MEKFNNKKIYILMIMLASILSSYTQNIIIPLEQGEKIWSGIVKEGENMPHKAGFNFDFYANNRMNQIQPLLLSNKGLWVWSEEPFKFEILIDKLVISNRLGEVKYGREGKSLSTAREYASSNFFHASGKMPDQLLFTQPQFNTWIELTYNQNQVDIMKYAKSIIDNGFKPGVFMIDASWQEDYGLWNFHPGRFPDPTKMMKELHNMGFKVILWICPFVSADQAIIVRDLKKQKALYMYKATPATTWKTAVDPAIVPWWDGYSAVLDFSNKAAVEWFDKQLEYLVKKYGVDGFKFDAGDMQFYPDYALSRENVSPNRQAELFAQFGLKYPLNEYRACWKMAGQPLAQRLHDKNHLWADVQKLIPQMLVENLSGYTFSCPDMIGGGDWVSFIDLKTLDQELIVRSAQIHALMPMMQFSVAPWRVLNDQHLSAVKKAVQLREKYIPYIMSLVEKSAKTGLPIVAPMEYYFPNQGYENIVDQFMLGDKFLVAPVIEKDVVSQKIVLPKGNWKDISNGKRIKGGKIIDYPTPLEVIPVFERM